MLVQKPDNVQDIQKAQEIACRWAYCNHPEITLKEIKTALLVLANFAEDVLFFNDWKENHGENH